MRRNCKNADSSDGGRGGSRGRLRTHPPPWVGIHPPPSRSTVLRNRARNCHATVPISERFLHPVAHMGQPAQRSLPGEHRLRRKTTARGGGTRLEWRRMRIVLLPGDGIGPEVTAEARRVLERVAPDVELEER